MQNEFIWPATCPENALVLRRGTRETPLYLRGTVPDLLAMRIAIVGSRNATEAQLALAEDLAEALASRGAIIVSGGARGIDAAALQGALLTDGKAIAVLPSDLNNPIPAQNRDLFERIVRGGGLLLTAVAQREVRAPPQFLPRNRLITQMVDGLIAVCADDPSGTRHCVLQAARLGVPIASVRWAEDSANSRGTNDFLDSAAFEICDVASAVVWLELLKNGTAPKFELPAPPSDRRAPKPARKLQSALKLPHKIDVAAAGSQCYGPQGEMQLQLPDGCDRDFAFQIMTILRESADEALGLEELVVACRRPRSDVATLVLQLALANLMERNACGGYTLRGLWPSNA